jgi:hypothetical protein
MKISQEKEKIEYATESMSGDARWTGEKRQYKCF